MTDERGLPVKLAITPGQTHDSQPAAALLADMTEGQMLLGDRAYDADWLRAFVAERGGWANIPPKRNRKTPICFSPALYKARNAVERFTSTGSGQTSINSNITDASPPAMTSSDRHTSP